ncbi:melibiose:sodium transporter MelB [Psychromonas ossibalaenae]|uniref:melibiose:sodium transporter MelB n=1 Tax=Psychromonas ossibalaenae TaxID=444922 RepID=UPI0003747B69|nr:melibiose:sodium transporter MelB [Psychromonas ossibalaenae]
MSAMIRKDKVAMPTKLAFGFGGFGKDFGLVVVNTFLFFYYTDVVGVSAAFIGSVFLGARIWDTINDPLLGYLVTKTKSRWGKYKPWIFIGNILNALFIVALFSAHLFSGTEQLIFIVITYVGWGMTYTLLDAPFWSLIPTITLDKGERERLMPYPRLLASLANYIASGVGVMAVSKLGAGDDGQGFMLFAVISGVLAIISATVTCIWTEQSFEENSKTAKPLKIKDALRLIFKNDQFIVLLSLALLYNIAANMTGGLNLYFYTYVLGDQSLFTTYMLWAGIFGTGSLLVFPKLMEQFGRKFVFSVSLLLPVISAAMLYLVANYAPESKILVSMAGISGGISNAIYWLMILLMVADTVDYGDMKMGIRSESVSYSVHTLISKCSGALTGFLIGISLTMISYIPNQEQTADTVQSLQLIYLAPALLCLISYFIYIKFYLLNDHELDKVQQNLEEKYAADTAEAL